jgi:membrane-bound lytic murein transglycosylase B
MYDLLHPPHPHHLARRAVALVLAACVLGGCSGQGAPEPVAEPARTASASPALPDDVSKLAQSPAPERATEQALAPLPSRPATRSATALARQLDRAETALRHPEATAAQVRRAGEFEQLAVRTLASASEAFRDRATRDMQARTRRATRNHVRAARTLLAWTTPVDSLPDWRIVAPPPPGKLLGYYRRAQRRTGVPWTYLAAINLVETRMGRIRGTSSAGALGPMQFLPSTWDLYGAGGDINDPRDAILAAARLLKANGAPGDMAEAVWHYNPSDYYVRAVMQHARAMQRSKAAYRGYWHWQVLYSHERGTYVLPVGYPDRRPVLLRDR